MDVNWKPPPCWYEPVQNADEIPNVPNAPTSKTLTECANDKVKVKGRAELPNTGLRAQTTATPIALHLNPGTEDAETYPASGDCTISTDGSIGTPYTQGDADRTPPCGIRYLRATNVSPYRLTASLTWQLTWAGSDGTRGDLPDVNVQEIQSVNR